VQELPINADELVSTLLRLAENEIVCLLDSCGVGHLGSHLLIAGIEPVEVFEITNDDPSVTLNLLDEILSCDQAAIFTISYEFGKKLLNIPTREKIFSPPEPDVFLATFDSFIVHDYDTRNTSVCGKIGKIEERLRGEISDFRSEISDLRFEISDSRSEIKDRSAKVTSNFTKPEYLAAIEVIKERIRRGDTFQTNLTQQLSVELQKDSSPAAIFERLRRDHPAPFSTFIKRTDSTIISASPERFFRVRSPHVSKGNARAISTSPIKGTRRRGESITEDERLRNDLLTSEKDRAENTMIVDLLRNDLGRVCEFGSVNVEKLCDLEEHPTLFHLVSTINGELRDDVKFSDILRAVFPCGSITGAPKISTMKIIDEIETADRGLSMGAIGYYLPTTWHSSLATCDLSVAIRTMVVRDNVATFNVGGGITIDSDPEKEFDETLLKAKALLNALGHAGTI